MKIGDKLIIHPDDASIRFWEEHDILASVSPFIRYDGSLYGIVSDIQYDGRVIVTVE